MAGLSQGARLGKQAANAFQTHPDRLTVLSPEGESREGSWAVLLHSRTLFMLLLQRCLEGINMLLVT